MGARTLPEAAELSLGNPSAELKTIQLMRPVLLGSPTKWARIAAGWVFCACAAAPRPHTIQIARSEAIALNFIGVLPTCSGRGSRIDNLPAARPHFERASEKRIVANQHVNCVGDFLRLDDLRGHPA